MKTKRKPYRDDSPDVLTASETARLLRISRTKVYELLATSKLPHRRLSARVLRFSRARLLEYMAGSDCDGDGNGKAGR